MCSSIRRSNRIRRLVVIYETVFGYVGHLVRQTTMGVGVWFGRGDNIASIGSSCPFLQGCEIARKMSVDSQCFPDLWFLSEWSFFIGVLLDHVYRICLRLVSKPTLSAQMLRLQHLLLSLSGA
jgi:hypothetical protein